MAIPDTPDRGQLGRTWEDVPHPGPSLGLAPAVKHASPGGAGEPDGRPEAPTPRFHVEPFEATHVPGDAETGGGPFPRSDVERDALGQALHATETAQSSDAVVGSPVEAPAPVGFHVEPSDATPVPGDAEAAHPPVGQSDVRPGTDQVLHDREGPASQVAVAVALGEDGPAEPSALPSPGSDPNGAATPFHVEPATEPADASAPPPAGSFHVEQPVLLPPRPARPLPRIMAVANQKGGVGKTTTAVNLGAALAELGYRTLVVDLDPQGNATTGLGINARGLQTSVYDVLMRELPIEDAIEPTSVRNLFVVPATIDLAGAEIELVPAFSRELRLKRALGDVADDFDFTLVDCPPSLGLLTVNALAAATEVVVPVQCEYYALEGLSALLRNVKLVQTNLNPALEMSTIILTMYDARTKLAEQVANEVRLHFGNVVCRHMVPRTVRLSEAPSFGQPIIVFDPNSRGAIAYRELAKEVSGGTPQRVG